MKNKKILSITIFSILILFFLLPSNMIISTSSFSQNNHLPSLKADPVILIDDDSDITNTLNDFVLNKKNIDLETRIQLSSLVKQYLI